MKAFVVILLFFHVAIQVYQTDASKYEENEVNDQEKSFIVDQHNYFRKLVATGNLSGQPKSSNELQMSWYGMLQYQAQNTADMLQFMSCYNNFEDIEKKHIFMYNSFLYDINYNKYVSRSKSYTKGAKWNSILYKWFNEHYNYRFGKNYNNYTQIVWGNTFNIGCGYSAYRYKNSYYKFYICLYGPAGNVRGQEPYTVGTGCEELCPAPRIN